MKRLLAAIGALTVASLFVMGPVLGWLEELAWGLDKPGYWSLEQAFTIALVLLALLYVLFGLLVARWSDIQGLRVAASVALAIPFTLGFMWLFSSLLHGLVTSGVVDLSWAAHSPVWRAYVRSADLIQECYQVPRSRGWTEVIGRTGGRAVPADVVYDYPILLRESRHLRLPHAVVHRRAMREDHGRASLRPRDTKGEIDSIGCAKVIHAPPIMNATAVLRVSRRFRAARRLARDLRVQYRGKVDDLPHAQRQEAPSNPPRHPA